MDRTPARITGTAGRRLFLSIGTTSAPRTATPLTRRLGNRNIGFRCAASPGKVRLLGFSLLGFWGGV